MRLSLRTFVLALLTAVLVPAAALGHELFDHPQLPLPQPDAPTMEGTQAGGPAARWEFQRSYSTGNLQSDLDFFKQGGEMYASVGTFSSGGRGGQSIFRLTRDGGQAIDPVVVSNHPSASCAPSSGVTGLQHDVEATPKGIPAPGDVLYNTTSTAATAVKADTQLLVDATDASGRCHDNGTFGQAAPRGGLEFIDVSNPDQTKDGSLSRPKEIVMTNHIGESHTVNIDPKRPHIAFSVTSDSISVDGNGRRANEPGGTSTGLDGFEVVDFRSCLETPLGTLPRGATVAEKRELCRPRVFRYRYPSVSMAIGHTLKSSIFACHEVEIYANDLLTCGGGAAAMIFDLKQAFDDRGTPTDFTDDVPRGTPLPCRVRNSTSTAAFQTTAKVVDCVSGEVNGQTQSLTVRDYPQGDRSLEGVRFLGNMTHAGRAGTGQVAPFSADQDIDFDHELEFTESGRFLLATDERGGGILPPGATCAQGNPNPQGNGGLHAYRFDRLRDPLREGVATRADAERQYAQTPIGTKAIYRAPIRTAAEETECTSHVFQQVPGQNRIFMGWYSQGTQVVDFTENADGTIEFREAGFFIPPNANQWVSHVYRVQENADGTFTYHGTAGDFALSNGRNAVEFYKVTLPAPPRPSGTANGAEFGTSPATTGTTTGTTGKTGTTGTTGSGATNQPAAATPTRAATPVEPPCVAGRTLRSVSARAAGSRGLRLGFASGAPVTVDLFQQSAGRQVTGERLVVRFRNRRGSAVSFNGLRGRGGRRVTDGFYVARFTVRQAGSASEVLRIALQRRGGRFRAIEAYDRRDRCTLLRSFKLERPVFGGRTNRALNIAFRVAEPARVAVTVRRGSRVVRSFAARDYAANRTHRLRQTVTSRLPRGLYRVTIAVTRNGRTTTETLSARRI